MTTKEYLEKLEQAEKRIRTAKEVEECFRDVHNTVSRRVFIEGRDSKGRKLRSKKGKHRGPGYSNRAGYFSDRKLARRFKGGNTGKTGKRFFNSGKPHKTKYFKGGYRALRRDQGVNAAFVDLNLTGNLSRDFTASFRRINKTTWASGVTRTENVAKINGAISKYGDEVFRVSKKQLKELTACAAAKAVKAVTE